MAQARQVYRNSCSARYKCRCEPISSNLGQQAYTAPVPHSIKSIVQACIEWPFQTRVLAVGRSAKRSRANLPPILRGSSKVTEQNLSKLQRRQPGKFLPKRLPHSSGERIRSSRVWLNKLKAIHYSVAATDGGLSSLGIP